VEQGCGACGCGVTYPAHSGGLGSPSGPTTGVCHSCWLDVALVNGGKPSGSAECGALRLCPEERSRGQKSPRWRAVRRCAVAACRRSGGADRDKTTLCASRRAATPHLSEGDCSHLGRASAARLLERGCLKFESVMWRAGAQSIPPTAQLRCLREKQESTPQKKNARGERAFSIQKSTRGEVELLCIHLTTLGDIATRIPEFLSGPCWRSKW
jgi:hypothetical protein